MRLWKEQDKARSGNDRSVKLDASLAPLRNHKKRRYQAQAHLNISASIIKHQCESGAHNIILDNSHWFYALKLKMNSANWSIQDTTQVLNYPRLQKTRPNKQKMENKKIWRSNSPARTAATKRRCCDANNGGASNRAANQSKHGRRSFCACVMLPQTEVGSMSRLTRVNLSQVLTRVRLCDPFTITRLGFPSEVQGLVADSENNVMRTLSATKARTSDGKLIHH